MADLEDLILKQNVPGRYQSWERKERVENLSDNEEDRDDEPNILEDAKKMNEAEVPESVMKSILAKRENQSRTGVKGVLADYKMASAVTRAQAEAELLQRQKIISEIVSGHKVAEQQLPAVAPKVAESDEDDDEDDEFLSAYREKRRQEFLLQNELPTFGQLKEIEENDFLDEVEQVDKRCFVVVHLCELGIHVCSKMNHFLREIAAEMRHVKFLYFSASSNHIEVDPVSLPILTIYRGGDTVKVLAGIANDLGPNFAKEDVRWLLDLALKEVN